MPAKLYELGVRTRIALYQSGYLKSGHLRSPVISIGNLTVGGTGKTPLAAYLARYLQGEGHEVAVLSRGYRRASRGVVEVANTEAILSNPSTAGDEPFLLASSCPGVRVVVGKKRVAAGKWIEDRAPVSVFLLDDGYQHLGLDRDLDLVLIDASDPVGGARMVPFGRLREPLTSLRRADAVIVTRSDEAFDQAEVRRLISQYCRAGTPVFYAYHDLTSLRRLDESNARVSPMVFSRRPVAMISGVARPERFLADLEHFGMSVVFRRRFRDHHRYLREEVSAFVEAAEAAGAEAILTTEKDAVNLPEDIATSSILPIYVAEIAFRCEEEVALKSLVLRAARHSRCGLCPRAGSNPHPPPWRSPAKSRPCGPALR